MIDESERKEGEVHIIVHVEKSMGIVTRLDRDVVFRNLKICFLFIVLIDKVRVK